MPLSAGYLEKVCIIGIEKVEVIIITVKKSISYFSESFKMLKFYLLFRLCPELVEDAFDISQDSLVGLEGLPSCLYSNTLAL